MYTYMGDYGCLDAQDVFCHYLVCPVRRHIVSQQIGHENSIAIGQRLCYRTLVDKTLGTLPFVTTLIIAVEIMM